MAGDWIKFDKATPDKPEVWQMASTLEIDPDAVVGKLLRVWAWFDEQSRFGNAPSVTKSLLDRRVGVTGFCNAMIDVGWLDDDGDLLQLPNFERHNGETAKTRALGAKRQQKHKAKSNAKGNDTGVTKPSPEKRREEKSNNKTPHTPLADASEGDSTIDILADDFESPDQPDKSSSEKPEAKKPKSGDAGYDPAGTIDQRFVIFWEQYPRKVAKGAALKAWHKIKPDKSLLDRILDAIVRAKRSEQWKRDGGQYIPHPATWLNQGRWDDELEPMGANHAENQHRANQQPDRKPSLVERVRANCGEPIPLRREPG
jgi:hypothetical protein